MTQRRKAPESVSARPTMRDVARRAGVGLGTVSRVVNGSGSVREETAQRVQEAIAEIGFRRNELARSLRPGQQSRTLGLLCGDLTNPFFASFAKAAVSVAEASGYAVLLSTADEDPQAEERAIGELLGRRVAGLIAVPGQGDHGFLADAPPHDRVPIVFADRPAAGFDADVVLTDNEGGARRAVRHLVEHGHERIAILVAPSYYTTGRRLRGYRRALREAGLAADDALVATLPRGSAVEAEAAMSRLFAAGRSAPTAVFSTTGPVTEGALRGAKRLGVTPAVVGFDDVRLADLLPLPVTVVATDAAELGRRAASLLLDRLDGAAGPPRRVTLPATLVARGTGELRA